MKFICSSRTTKTGTMKFITRGAREASRRGQRRWDWYTTREGRNGLYSRL